MCLPLNRRIVGRTGTDTTDDIGPDGLDLGEILDGSHFEEYQSHGSLLAWDLREVGWEGLNEESW